MDQLSTQKNNGPLPSFDTMLQDAQEALVIPSTQSKTGQSTEIPSTQPAPESDAVDTQSILRGTLARTAELKVALEQRQASLTFEQHQRAAELIRQMIDTANVYASGAGVDASQLENHLQEVLGELEAIVHSPESTAQVAAGAGFDAEVEGSGSDPTITIDQREIVQDRPDLSDQCSQAKTLEELAQAISKGGIALPNGEVYQAQRFEELIPHLKLLPHLAQYLVLPEEFGFKQAVLRILHSDPKNEQESIDVAPSGKPLKLEKIHTLEVQTLYDKHMKRLAEFEVLRQQEQQAKQELVHFDEQQQQQSVSGDKDAAQRHTDRGRLSINHINAKEAVRVYPEAAIAAMKDEQTGVLLQLQGIDKNSSNQDLVQLRQELTDVCQEWGVRIERGWNLSRDEMKPLL